MTTLTIEQRDELAELMASNVAPHLTYAVHLKDEGTIADLLIPLDWQELTALVVVLAKRCTRPLMRPDDGVVDDVAVERACDGERIPLTGPERLAAGRILAAQGVGPTEAAKRLHVAKTVAERLLAKANAPITREQAARNLAVLEAAVEEDPASPEELEGTE